MYTRLSTKALPAFLTRGGIIAQGFGFTRDYLKERNNSAYCRLKKIPCEFKEQARARHPGEKCGLVISDNLIACKISFNLTRMPLAEDMVTSRYRISAYDTHSVSINEVEYRQSLVLSALKIICPWPAPPVQNLDDEIFRSVLELNPEVVLLGTGTRQQFPSPKVFALFGEKGIGLEVMDNGALSRTFNILVAEDRAVVAAIMI